MARRDPEWVWNEIQEGQFRPQNAPFQGVERIKERIPKNPSALDYFNLYFTNRIIDHMVTETNKYADQILEQQRDNIRPHSMLCQRVPTTCNEMCAFLGPMMLMGIIYKPRLGIYWSIDELYNTPIFKSIMSRDRFLLMIKFLHFADNVNYDANNRNRDRLFKIREMTDMINQRCRAVYAPCEDLSLDESLVLFKGRLLFKQYIKTKRARFGIKLYELCTYNGIMLNFMIYHGNQEAALVQPPGYNWLQTERIPLILLEPYLGNGHTVYFDNYYTTPRLVNTCLIIKLK